MLKNAFKMRKRAEEGLYNAAGSWQTFELHAGLPRARMPGEAAEGIAGHRRRFGAARSHKAERISGLSAPAGAGGQPPSHAGRDGITARVTGRDSPTQHRRGSKGQSLTPDCQHQLEHCGSADTPGSSLVPFPLKIAKKKKNL